MYWDVCDLYGQAMQQKLPENGFKWRNDTFNFYEDLTQNYNESSDKGYIFKVNFDYPKELQKSHSDLAFLPERMKICKCQKVRVIFITEKICYTDKSSEKTLGRGPILQKPHSVIEFN